MELPHALLEQALDADGPIIFLTGAGISAESGIPTFRGPEGYWTAGSREYRPQDLATREAFLRIPADVWSWYLYRRSVCRAASPNPAHEALVALEPRLGDRFLLVTQNVDGLHLRAGSSPERTWQIHGNIDFMRCLGECSLQLTPVPLDEAWEKGRQVTEGDLERLRCPRCGGRARPHVLWFDEYYDEPHFRFESAMHAAGEAALLVVVGTTGATNLPLHMGALVARRGAPMIVVNPEPNPFSEWVDERGNGVFLQGTAGAIVPSIAEALGEAGPP